LVNEVARVSRDDNIMRFGHPCGTIDIEMETQNGVITRAAVGRTARRIMEGHVYVPCTLLEQ
jgi:2-methylaconitate cis-trans-isomerase PrpF